MTEEELENIAGVVKAIEYIQPRWSDVLADGTPNEEFVRKDGEGDLIATGDVTHALRGA